MGKRKEIFGIPLFVSNAMPDDLALLIEPPRSPVDMRSLAERTTMIDCRTAEEKM